MVVKLMALSPEIRMFRAFVLMTALAFGICAPDMAAADAPNEYEIKAVMLFNLTHFVEWPSNAFADATSPIVIGIVGRDPFGRHLEEAVRGETVNGRRIVIKHFARAQALAACHVLFVCADEKSKLDQIFSKLKGRPVLTVSEIEKFSALPGGMVLFYTNGQKKVRLRLNLETARSAGLNISSQLIQVAEPEKTSYVPSLGREMGRITVSTKTRGDFGLDLTR